MQTTSFSSGALSVRGHRTRDFSFSASCSSSYLAPQRPCASSRMGRPGCVSRTFRTPAAVSFHGLREPVPSVRDMSEEEKVQRVKGEADRIKEQTHQRAEKLKREAHLKHLEHELKFGRLMFSQGSYESALEHFNKVIQGSDEDSYYRGEGTLQKAACLEKLGREAEAHTLYESLIRFRAPYPNIKRRAAEALFGSTSEAGKAPVYDDYMYRMFLSGFGSYMPKEKYVETKEEKVIMSVLPWAMLLMAPLLLVSLLFFPQ